MRSWPSWLRRGPHPALPGPGAGDECVLVEPRELDDIAPGRSQTLETSGFVDLDQVAPIVFDKTYYVGPPQGARSTPRCTPCCRRPWRRRTGRAWPRS
ncbi:Ku protein [Streptomyces sp. NPDC091371]|uniref:Ku protein n=1 Tax=Streptomyces sp. NPDC091371 TaxID=3155303 RepID=UPI003411FD95